MSGTDDFEELKRQMVKDKQGNKKFWSPASDKEGTSQLRFLPHVKELGEKVFYLHHKVHWVNGRSYECIKQTLTDKEGNTHEAEECPICNFSRKLFATSEKGSDDFDLAYDLSAKDRYVYRVVVRGKPNEKEPEFFESGKKLFGVLYHILTETDYGNICDLKEGRDFNLVKTGTGRRSNYDTSIPSANVSQAFKTVEELKELIANLKKMNFNQLIEFNSSDAMKEALKSYLSGDSKKQTTDEPEAKKPVAAAKTSPAVEEPKESTSSNEMDDLLSEFGL
jgi:hypothetical protein